MSFAVEQERVMYDKDKIKFELPIESVFDLVNHLGGEPQMKLDMFTATTICHNHPGEGSHKLYYYDNTHLFHCYTSCGDYFDIFELVMRVKQMEGHSDWNLVNSLFYVAEFFSLEGDTRSAETVNDVLLDMQLFDRYQRIYDTMYKDSVSTRTLTTFSDSFLKHYPLPEIVTWTQEGIEMEVMREYGIKYNPSTHGIIIPHYSVESELLGVRERTLIRENEKFGKYRPAVFNGQMYNHPVGFSLYNINNSASNIAAFERVVVFEGEKSPLLYASYFGRENDISCSCSGSSISRAQIEMLIELGAKEIIIGMDRQYKEHGDEEWEKHTKALTKINDRYSNSVLISFLFDKDNLLDYKDSPIDKGKDVFLKLLENRVII